MPLTTSSYFAWPTIVPADSTSSVLLIDAATEKAAAVWRVGAAGAIRKLYFRLGTVTTGDTLLVSLQDIDGTTGDPDGTADQSGTVVVADTDDNTWKSVTLGADRTVAVGDWLGGVVEYNSFVAGSMVILRSLTSWHPGYTDLYTGTWGKGGPTAILAVEYSDGLYYPQPGLLPGVPSSVSFHVNTSGFDEYGMHFTMPFPARAVGGGFWSSLSGDANLVLYNTNGTSVMASAVIDASNQATNSAQERNYFFNTPATLAVGSAYRLTIQPSTTTSDTLRYIDCPVAAARGQLPGGTAIQLTKQLDVTGSWTEVDTQRPLMWLLLDQAHDGTGGVIGMGGARGGFQ